MNSLSSYFQKIRSLLTDKSLEKDTILIILKEIFNVEVPLGNLRLSNDGIVYIKDSPSLRNSIFLRKKEIIELCQKRGVRVTDFR